MGRTKTEVMGQGRGGRSNSHGLTLLFRELKVDPIYCHQFFADNLDHIHIRSAEKDFQVVLFTMLLLVSVTLKMKALEVLCLSIKLYKMDLTLKCVD